MSIISSGSSMSDITPIEGIPYLLSRQNDAQRIAIIQAWIIDGDAAIWGEPRVFPQTSGSNLVETPFRISQMPSLNIVALPLSSRTHRSHRVVPVSRINAPVPGAMISDPSLLSDRNYRAAKDYVRMIAQAGCLIKLELCLADEAYKMYILEREFCDANDCIGAVFVASLFRGLRVADEVYTAALKATCGASSLVFGSMMMTSAVANAIFGFACLPLNREKSHKARYAAMECCAGSVNTLYLSTCCFSNAIINLVCLPKNLLAPECVSVEKEINLRNKIDTLQENLINQISDHGTNGIMC